MNYYVLSKLCYLIATVLLLIELLVIMNKRQRRYRKEIVIRETQIMQEREEKQ